MDFNTFNSLEEYEQFQILFEQGVLLLDRNDPSSSYLLYQLNGFYIEIQQLLSENSINSITSFSSTEPLEPYLENIELDKLF